MPVPEVSETHVRVNYSETDQMGVVYHARYLVWFDIARTEHLRLSGASYRDLEAEGLRLVVSRRVRTLSATRPVRRPSPHPLLGARRGHPPGRIRIRRGPRG